MKAMLFKSWFGSDAHSQLMVKRVEGDGHGFLVVTLRDAEDSGSGVELMLSPWASKLISALEYYSTQVDGKYPRGYRCLELGEDGGILEVGGSVQGEPYAEVVTFIWTLGAHTHGVDMTMADAQSLVKFLKA